MFVRVLLSVFGLVLNHCSISLASDKSHSFELDKKANRTQDSSHSIAPVENGPEENLGRESFLNASKVGILLIKKSEKLAVAPPWNFSITKKYKWSDLNDSGFYQNFNRREFWANQKLYNSGEELIADFDAHELPEQYSNPTRYKVDKRRIWRWKDEAQKKSVQLISPDEIPSPSVRTAYDDVLSAIEENKFLLKKLRSVFVVFANEPVEQPLVWSSEKLSLKISISAENPNAVALSQKIKSLEIPVPLLWNDEKKTPNKPSKDRE